MNNNIVKKNYDDHIVLLNPQKTTWISLTYEGYLSYEEIRAKGVTVFSNKYEVDPKEVEQFIDEIDNTLFPKENFRNDDTPNIAMTVFLTDSCNFKCKHCFYSCGGANNNVNISLKLNDEYKKFIKEFVLYGGKHITFTGGEPLLNRNLEQFIKHAFENKLGIFLLTNGSLITERLAKLLFDYNVYVQVSLDGDENAFEKIREGGKYSEVVKGIQFLKNYNVKYDISFMPSKLNIDSFHNVIDFAVENQAQQIHLPFFEEYGSGGINSDIIKLENDKFEVFLVDLVKNYFNGLRDRIKIYLFEGIIENLENRTRKEVCSVGTKTLALYSSGDIYPCSELILPDYKLGNINDESIDFSKIKHNNIVDFFSKLTVDTIEKCSDCEFRYYCGGGCRVHANIGSGRFDVEDNYCSIIKLLYNNILNQISR